jgi:hypothetical protein
VGSSAPPSSSVVRMFCIHVVPLFGYDAMKTSPGCSGIARHAASVRWLVMGSTGIDVEDSSASRSSVDPISPAASRSGESSATGRSVGCSRRLLPHRTPHWCPRRQRQTYRSSATVVNCPAVSTVRCVQAKTLDSKKP